MTDASEQDLSEQHVAVPGVPFRGRAQRVELAGYRVGGVALVEDVTMNLRYGDVLALVGPNGAGKSTLLGLLAGDIAPTAGAVFLDDRSLDAWTPKELSRARAVLLQANQVAFSFSVQQVVEMGRAPWVGTTDSDDDDRAITAAIAAADVRHLTARAFPTLSGGEKARVSLARVLAQDARIVLLDEPTAALDLRHQEEVLRTARRLASEGRAVVVVLHDLSLAAAYADQVAILARGRLVAHGSPNDVLTAERIEEVYDIPVRVLRDDDTGRPIVVPRRSL